MECCENCACYEEEWEYCFRNGNHAPRDGYCENYREEPPKPKEGVSVGEWISVKDRLPNVAGWYLVFYNGSKMQVAFFKGKKWPFDNHYHKVTHWMPLPEPPKEGT